MLRDSALHKFTIDIDNSHWHCDRETSVSISSIRLNFQFWARRSHQAV